ncbi:GDP-mannose 4,6-dehydratase [Candidatus Parcubacteria bacterium]|nr:GDP-mannose 4,6-dehydratase [Candidatus Parcubacteria bacterium]
MKKGKTALITGITGQDGSYLAENLLKKGYKVYGLVRRTSSEPAHRIQDLAFFDIYYGSKKQLKFIDGNLRDSETLARAINESEPDEIYNLAAQSDVGISFKIPGETMEVNYYGVGRLLNEALKINPKVRIYQASTSEMFGKTNPPQNEMSELQPVSPYGESKMKAHVDFIKGYRDRYGAFTTSGILFNHESPRRGKNFVTRKITHAFAKIKLGLQDFVELGNIEAKRDWGFAGDYVEAMWKMLQQPKPEDFVIATGITHSVRDFVEAAAEAAGMKLGWKGKGLDEVAYDKRGKVILKINKEWYRPTDVHYLLGDPSKARKVLKWKPKVDFHGLVDMMVVADLRELSRKN